MILAKEIDGILWVTAADHQAQIAALTAESDSLHRKRIAEVDRRQEVERERDALQGQIAAMVACTQDVGKFVGGDTAAIATAHDARVRDAAIEEMALRFWNIEPNGTAFNAYKVAEMLRTLKTVEAK